LDALTEARPILNPTTDGKALSVVLGVTITGAPNGSGAIGFEFVEGVLTSAQFGRIQDAEVTVEIDHQSAWGVANGSLQLSVAYMQGIAKISGAMSKAISLMAGSMMAGSSNAGSSNAGSSNAGGAL
jgi:hypothetical protein